MKKNVAIIVMLLCVMGLNAQTAYTPAAENLKAREWFKDARFGLFIHWGVYSLLGSGEWVMNNRNIYVEDYRRLQQIFNPQDFNAATWVSLAKNAGMKYITFTSRHHDSFSNWDTQQSDWKITNTPYGKDVVKALAEECQKQGIKLFLYYSTLDWFRSDYPHESGRTGKGTGRTKSSDWDSYFAFMKAQLTELLTNYGPIGGIWLDGHWDQLDGDSNKEEQSKINWHYDELYALIHRLQPACLIANNHHLKPFPGEDIQIFERDLPGENSAGLSGQDVSQALPLETCTTINGSWGFNITDRRQKSTRELIHLLVRAAGYNSNLLLNVGPMPNGIIQPEFTERLSAMGEWLQQYGITIYNTKGGFLKPQDWGAITQNENKYYIHILNKPDNNLISVVFPGKVKAMRWFDNTSSVHWDSGKQTGATTIAIDRELLNYDTVIEVIMN